MGHLTVTNITIIFCFRYFHPMSSSASPYLVDRTAHTPPSPSHTHHVPHILNSVEELVVKYRPPSEDRLTSAPTVSPESSPYHADPSNRDSPWPQWSGPPQTMLPFVKIESSAPSGKWITSKLKSRVRPRLPVESNRPEPARDLFSQL